MRTALRQPLTKIIHVNPKPCTAWQFDGLPVDVQPAILKRLVKCRKGASQSSTRTGLAIFGPEQGCERITAVTLACHSEIGDQRNRLACINFNCLPITLDAWWTQQG